MCEMAIIAIGHYKYDKCLQLDIFLEHYSIEYENIKTHF